MIEIKAQFPIGEYLKQINPFYRHPNYRCDFLFTYADEKGDVKSIIIEYDGFKEHFVDTENINEFNYQYYYKEDDIEREKILEGYGYKFLRLNRFNLGKNPEKTISEKLNYLLKKKALTPHTLTDDLRNNVEKLISKESKQCPKCKKVKDIEEFSDPSLKSGIGRICRSCKGLRSKPSKGYIKTGKKCPRCGSQMVLRNGMYGRFYGCSTYPKCAGTRQYGR
jgi:very-short-patch-repair endonuclease/phage FluMu protein Com